MAKKDNVFSYGQAATPNAEQKYSVIRWGWAGLNKSDTVDTGQITDCSGVNIEPPYVMSSLIPHTFTSYSEPISVFGFGERLFVIYRNSGKIKIDCILESGTKYTGTISNALGNAEDFKPRTMVQFNVASNTENIVEAEYIRKLLIFPDAYSIDFDINGNFEPKSLGNTYPDIKYASVYASRVFGVDDNLVYASSYNDYADWDLDTADEYSEANAWVSMSQSNVKADGVFTAITAYDNHVVLFKRDYMQLVYNNKNPFRIVDVGEFGCDNPYALAECGGILYFASSDAIYAYGGGSVTKISDELDIKSFRGCVLGSWEDTLYVSVGEGIYTYSKGIWSFCGAVGGGVIQFASCSYGISALHKDGKIRFYDWSEDNKYISHTWNKEYGSADGGEWWFESDLMALGSLNVRRVKKISLLCEKDDGAEVNIYLLKNDEKFDPAKSQLISHSDKDGRGLIRTLVRGFSSYMHKIRISGRGKVKIYAAEIQISWGGELYVEG